MSDNALVKLFEVGDPRAVALLQEAATQAKKLEEQEKELAKAAGLTAKEYAKVASEAEKAASNQTTLAQRMHGGWTEFKSKVDLLVGSFQALHAAANTVVELATEQERLDRVQTRLGLNFQAASRAASLYVSETQLATAAARMHAAGLHTTQEQLQALAVVASDYSRNTGDELEQTFDALTQGLIAGEQEGLRRFGPGLARLAGESHDAGERLAELVHTASRIPPVADSATTAWARMNGEMERNARESSRDFVNAFASTQQATRTAQDQMGKDTDVWLGKLAGGLVRFANATAPIIQGIVMPWKLFQGNTWRQVGEALGLTTRAATTAAPAVQAHTQALNDNAAAARNAAEWNQRVAEVWAIRPGQDWRSEVSGRPGTGSLGESIAAAERANRDLASREAKQHARDLRSKPQGGTSNAAERLAHNRERMNAWMSLGSDAVRFGIVPAGLSVGDFQRMFAGDIELARAEIAATRAADELELTRQAEAETDARALEQRFKDWEEERTEAMLRARRAAADAAQGRRAEALRFAEASRPETLLRGTFGFEDERARDPAAAQTARLQNRLTSVKSFADTAKQAWDSLGNAISSNLSKIAQGEQGVVEGMQNMVKEALTSLGQLALQKGIFYIFEGIASSIFAPAAAANYFIAGAGLTALGVGLSVAGGAIPEAGAAKSTGGGSSVASDAGNTSSSGGATTQTTVVNNYYYHPVVGGRSAADDEVGDGLRPYQPREGVRRAA